MNLVPTSAHGPIPSLLRSPRNCDYLVGNRLGAGAFGQVYEAVGPFDQSFAIKVFQPDPQTFESVRSAWLQEAARLHMLRHPNIVYVHDYFETGGRFFVVLERCDHSLEEMLARPFTERLSVEVMRQLLFAAQYLSDNDVVHNDLHAGNILTVQGPNLICKLSDFGISQELEGQRWVRAPLVNHRIMAPEVAQGGYTSRQSDIFQLGLLLYHMHTGHPALDTGAGLEQVVEQIRQGEPRRRAEALGTPLGQIAAVMLRRHEQYRYTNATQVWDDLRRLDLWRRG